MAAPGPAFQAVWATAQNLARQRRFEESLRVFDRLAALAPDNPSLLVSRGATLLLSDDSQNALRHFEDLTRSHPHLEDAWQGLGKALYDQHRAEEAVAAFTQAAGLSADPARALYHRGMAYLLMGDFARGWRDYEHRLTIPAFGHRVFAQPRWDGTPLAGRRLLVICEQGYGDVFQFARFLPVLRDRHGPFAFECPMELRDILAPTLDGLDIVPLRGRQAPDTRFDCYASLLSLPFLLKIEPADIPAAPAHLAIPPAPGRPPGFRAGVVWAGKTSHPQDSHRSMDPEFLGPLTSLPGVQFVSLQKETGSRPPLPGLCPFPPEPETPLASFMDTARHIQTLDLVVAVDTAVAHLAAAMGKPTWLLLSAAGEWRWLRERSDSPWYPTMRIFRQTRLGDWPSAIAPARAALARLLADQCRSPLTPVAAAPCS